MIFGARITAAPLTGAVLVMISDGAPQRRFLFCYGGSKLPD
jgi:hypothetical protein